MCSRASAAWGTVQPPPAALFLSWPDCPARSARSGHSGTRDTHSTSLERWPDAVCRRRAMDSPVRRVHTTTHVGLISTGWRDSSAFMFNTLLHTLPQPTRLLPVVPVPLPSPQDLFDFHHRVGDIPYSALLGCQTHHLKREENG